MKSPRRKLPGDFFYFFEKKFRDFVVNCTLHWSLCVNSSKK